MTADPRPDPAEISFAIANATGAAIEQLTHTTGFNLARIEIQLAHIADRLGEIVELLDQDQP